MPTTFQMDSEHGVAYARTLGETSSDELLESLAALLRHPGHSPGMSVFLDMVEVTPSLVRRDVLLIAQCFGNHQQEIGASKLAVVVPKDSSFGMARELEVELEESPVDMGVFRTTGEAREWLGLPAEEASVTDTEAVAG